MFWGRLKIPQVTPALTFKVVARKPPLGLFPTAWNQKNSVRCNFDDESEATLASVLKIAANHSLARPIAGPCPTPMERLIAQLLYLRI